MNDLKSWLTLFNIKGVGPNRFRALVGKFGSPAAALEASTSDLMSVPTIDEKISAAIKGYKNDVEIERQMAAIEKKGVRPITCFDTDYPELLKNIYDPPPMLFVKGTIKEEDSSAVAVVGTRNPKRYGKMMAEKLSKDLADGGITVVSGLARGIDSLAHKGALSRGGRTIGVLGCGVDVVYPPEHKKLFEAVIANGALISEFPMGTRPEAPNFPRRNRVISGMSLGVVIVQAPAKSGALLTARYALDQNREVFSVPGNVDDMQSRGTNGLIKQGAKLVEDVEDILVEIKSSLRIPIEPKPPVPDDVEELEPNERSVLQALSDEPKHIDAICNQTSLEPSITLAALLSLELSGLVRQLSGKMFLRQV